MAIAPLQSPFIPLTRVRLQPYITLRALPGGQFLAPGPIPSALIKQMILIGAIEKLTVNQERRENSQYAELNADTMQGTFGRPVETYPGLPRYSLELQRVVLYDANLLEAFGFAGSDIIAQKVPLIIQITKNVPIDPNTGAPLEIAPGVPLQTQTEWYTGCWFDKNTATYDVTATDLKVIQNATMITKGPISDVYGG